MAQVSVWAANDERDTRYWLAFAAACGMQEHGILHAEIVAEPQEPPTSGPDTREYFIIRDVLDHGPTDPQTGGAMVTGIKRRKYRIVLEEVDL